jgi:hypothetical protein
MQEPDEEAPPASTRVLRVRRVGDGFVVFAGDSEETPKFASQDEALAAARDLAGGRGALILVEGEDGLDAEAVPPSSGK